LLSFLPLAPLFENLMPATETIEQFQTYPVGDDPFDQAVFDDSVLIIEEALFSPIEPSEVILLGTSFSADRRWNFEGALKQALEVDVQNIAVQGQGPITPMANFLSDDSALSTDLKLVIWEIPERYLTVAYPQTSF
jgi:alginate O-acetyltransferase complex protein AlgJ